MPRPKWIYALKNSLDRKNVITNKQQEGKSDFLEGNVLSPCLVDQIFPKSR